MPRAAPPQAPPAAIRPPRVVLAGALAAMLLAALDASIVNTALPRMAAELGGLAHVSWVVTGFMLTSTITTPLYGKLSDTHGRRLMFGVSIGLFLVASMLCGASRGMNQLIGFRILQGLGAGGLLVLAQASIGDVVAPRDRPRYQGLFAGTFGLASVSGPLLGGIITQALSWRWIFYVNLPVGAVALAMIWFGLRGRERPARGPGGHIDYAGALLLTGLTSALLLLLAWGGPRYGWASAPAAILGLLSLTCLGLFIWRESRASEPLIRLGLFRNGVFARGCFVGGLAVAAMFGALVFMPLYYQLVLGMSPAASGVMMLPQVLGMLLTSILGGRIVVRFGRYRALILLGMTLMTASLAGLAGCAWAGAPAAAFLIAIGVQGLGMGMFMPNITNAVQNAVAPAEMGAATGTMVFIRSLNGAIGVAASGAILAARLDVSRLPAGFRIASHDAAALTHPTLAQHLAIAATYRAALSGCFAASAALMACTILLAVGMPEQKLRERAVPAGANAGGRK